MPNKPILRGSRWSVYERTSTNLLEHLCRIRGYEELDLKPDYLKDLHDPNLLPGILKARELLKEIRASGGHVTIFGDYDADGTPAAALLSILLDQLNIAHEVVLPMRESGYGLRALHVERAAKKSQLLITVDTGISSVSEVDLANKLGLKTIIIDHHLPPEDLPKADAIVDPFLKDSTYPFPHLCGCALAFKFACSLKEDYPEIISDTFLKWLLDLVAVSTVADMMPLIGENRVFVHYGLIVLRQNRRPGLSALLECASVKIEDISESTLGYIIGPRLNASGRISDNRPAYELLVSNNLVSAKPLALQLEQANILRQEMVEKVLSEANEVLSRQNELSDLVFILHKEDWPSGVVGLVAGKLAAQHSRPVVVATSDGGRIRASARSIPKYPLIDGLSRQSHLLETFGGHRQAAGLSAELKNWPEFCVGLKRDAAEVLTEEDLVPTYLADAIIESSDLTLRVASSLESLRPFGLGNSKPLLILPQTRVEQVRFIGSKQNHLKTTLNSFGVSLDGIGFNMADRYKRDPRVELQLLGYLENNRWNGRESLQFQIVDYQEASAKVDRRNV